MAYYYCSGFDHNNAFFMELEQCFKKELKDTSSIVYIPAGKEAFDIALNKYVPIYTDHFKKIGIEFDNVNMIKPGMKSDKAKELVRNASFIMLMGGNPYEEKKLIEKLDIVNELREYKGVMLGYSAGAMLMSKYIIIVPCSDEYPDFHIEEGLGLSDISIYPHNNFEGVDYPEYVDVDGEVTRRDDLIKVAGEYGDFYLLQDYYREVEDKASVSIIMVSNNRMKYLTYNDGKVWRATGNGIKLEKVR